MHIAQLAALVAGALVCVPPVSAAGAPVAVVEDVAGRPTGVELMDYVDAGKIIRLNAQDTIVLGYLKSCVRETITGGTVIVGTERSEVQSGKVERTTVACDAGRMLLTAQQASQFAGMVFRGPTPDGKPASIPQPQFTLYGLSPMVELKGAGLLVIERLDQPGERHDLKIGKQQLLRGAFFDLAKAGKSLNAGGIYRATAGAQQIVFKVDPGAKPGPGPVVGRLLRFEPAS